VDVVSGEVTALQPRLVETDLRLSFGGAGGPVFNGSGIVVGLTVAPLDEENKRSRDFSVVRMGIVCEAAAAARASMTGTPPKATHLPIEPSKPYPADALAASSKGVPAAIDPPVLSSADFDVALITPPMVSNARQRADWTGGRTTRAPEAVALIGRLTEFGAWSDYFGELPPVLAVRVTPKMVEGFWKRMAREAARTQGAVLPPFKDFKANFLRMRASCGATEVPPIHPFVLEHRLSDKNVIREGLYVFDPDALGPKCGSVTLSLFSEKAPERADIVTIDPRVLDRIWQDFAPLRESGR
jgi:hypothetical protein